MGDREAEKRDPVMVQIDRGVVWLGWEFFGKPDGKIKADEIQRDEYDEDLDRVPYG